jgi:hypothetical protein
MLPITTNSERICHWTRIRRTGGPSNGAVTSLRGQFSADFIINIAGCSYRQGQGTKAEDSTRKQPGPRERSANELRP